MARHTITVEQISQPVVTTLALTTKAPTKVLKMHAYPESATARFEISTETSCQFVDTLKKAVQLYNEY